MSNSSNPPSAPRSVGGGLGTVPAWGRPDLVVAAPGGIAMLTPANSIYSAGNTMTVVAHQDINVMAGANHATAVQGGMVFYTYGKATNPDKPNQETGIQLHAASGSVHCESQTGATRLTADKAVNVSSTTGMVRITAPKHILLTAGGAALRIDDSGITLLGPGKIEFRASMKELGGPAGASASVDLGKPGKLDACSRSLDSAASSQAGAVAFG